MDHTAGFGFSTYMTNLDSLDDTVQNFRCQFFYISIITQVRIDLSALHGSGKRFNLLQNVRVQHETEGTGKNRTQRVMIHYKFVGVIEIPDDGDNYTADTRKGVAVEYVTKSA